jgi:hypothetical protein
MMLHVWDATNDSAARREQSPLPAQQPLRIDDASKNIGVHDAVEAPRLHPLPRTNPKRQRGLLYFHPKHLPARIRPLQGSPQMALSADLQNPHRFRRHRPQKRNVALDVVNPRLF